jgi:spectinomycin phosphotransferase
MRETPLDLSNEMLLAALRAGYGLEIASLTFLPLGYDASAWVYRAQAAGGATFFLKVRTRIANQPSLLVPRYLHDHGVMSVIAPLPTTAQALWAELDNYVLILYPFVEGTAGMERGMSPQQWVDYGGILRQIHSTAVEPGLAQIMRRETFTPASAETLRRVDAHISDQAFEDPSQQELAAFWRGQRDMIHTILERALDLGRRLAQVAPPFVLCHADIHTGNVLLDEHQRVWIVDWDETVLAPKERDLMFAIGGISSKLVGRREEQLFLQGYGEASIDPLALAYYRYAWAVGDIGEFGAQVFFRPDLGEISRREGTSMCIRLFEPGEIVAQAFGSDVPGA